MSDTNTASTPAQANTRGHKKERVGEVISSKMTKTIVVRVQRRFPHPRFKKVVTQFNKFYAHDEKAKPNPVIACASRSAVRSPGPSAGVWLNVVERNAEPARVTA
jgi:small subunit ribosomal protein S17